MNIERQSSFLNGASSATENTPLIGKPSLNANEKVENSSAPQATSNSWSFKFPSLSACASSIRSFTSCISSSFSSALKNIKWSMYNCVASFVKPDQMNYSSETVQGTTMAGDSVFVPSAGSFKAGGGLLNKLTRSLFSTVVSETTTLEHNPLSKALEPKGIHQAGKDIVRCMEFTIRDEAGNGGLIGFNPASDNEQGNAKEIITAHAAGRITELVDGNALFATAIISTANQTLGNTLNLLAFRADKNLTAENGIGFPSSSEPTIKYDLQKVVSPQPTHYLLKCEITAPAVGFLLKKSAAEVESEMASLKEDALSRIAQMDEKNKSEGGPLCTPAMKIEMITAAEKEARRAKLVSFATDLTSPDNPHMESKISLSIKITPNPNFAQTKAESADNFPCSLEVLEFTNEFTTAQSRGKVVPEKFA